MKFFGKAALIRNVWDAPSIVLLVAIVVAWALLLGVVGFRIGERHGYEAGYQEGVISEIQIKERTNLSMQKAGVCDWVREAHTYYGCLKHEELK